MQEQDGKDVEADEVSVSTAAALEDSGGSAESWMPTVSAFQYAWLLAILPGLSAVFPAIVTAAQDAAVPEDRRFLVILFLLLKRIYLYSCALSIVDVAARRSVVAPAALGQRIQTLNKELLGGVVSAPELERLSDSKEAKEMYGQMDQVDSGTQALLLPLFLALVLGSSYAAIQLFSQAPPPSPDSSLSLEPVFRSVSALSNAGICLLFTRTEFLEALKTFRARVLGSQEPPSDGAQDPLSGLALGLSALAVGGSYLGPQQFVWPLRNVVNSCLAITVARAVQLPRLSFVVAALGGLMLYDGVGVNGPLLALPAGAETVGPSVMEQVARAKLGGAGWWQPGLLSVVIGGKTTDALGLADTVFPALMAGWAMRQDQKEAGAQDPGALPRALGYSRAALGGYAVGCFGMEVFQGGGGGQAALLYIVPCMFGAVAATAAVRGEFTGRIWEGP